MYTNCLIQYVDDPETYWVTIKSTEYFDEPEEEDEEIFFYGLSKSNLEAAKNNHTLMEGEWYVLEVGESYETLP